MKLQLTPAPVVGRRAFTTLDPRTVNLRCTLPVYAEEAVRLGGVVADMGRASGLSLRERARRVGLTANRLAELERGALVLGNGAAARLWIAECWGVRVGQKPRAKEEGQ